MFKSSTRSGTGEPAVDPLAPVIALRGVRKAFGDNVVLDGVDLEVRRAENVVVLGRSGSGKSVLIKLVVGLLRPDAGEVVVLGRRVDTLAGAPLDALRSHVGFSFQSSALYDSMDVSENLAFPLRMNSRDLSAAEIDDRVAAALLAVGLPDTARQMPSELSGGQRKRIGIARTLILKPEILLYDEPTAGLDPVTCAEINELILKVKADFHTSAIVITHDLTCARATGDRVAMLFEGRVLVSGTFEEVFASQDPRVKGFHDYHFLGGNP